ncbi:hypothetical protein POF51_26065 [Brevibacillus sp. AG]|uniref:hypothetical protein n=1 Tax=Brevibacillus sp. AG TaxID=3020891 RepID=UPI0023313D42|nr:hypothetical protein [Brevibacillus sp. AG]MDC0764190.1 hypothetical protein [Brevibacillus sp. AG]
MTIVAAYKQGDTVSIVSDFRASFHVEQVDAILKYFQVDDRMGFFTAGSVLAWKEAADHIRSIANQINVSNVATEDGPLHSGLRRIVERFPVSKRDRYPLFGGIGVYWDKDTQQTVYFELRGELSQGLLIRPLQDGITVLGSGSGIPGIQELLTQKIQYHLIRNQGFYPKDAAEYLRNVLKGAMKACGPSSFEKFGISPIFSIAGMNPSGFRMEGEELIGHLYSGGVKGHPYHYSFERVENQIILNNHLSNTTIPLQDVSSFQHNGTIGLEFDPEGLTTGFDPMNYVSGDVIYILSQDVGPTYVERRVCKTHPVACMDNRFSVADPQYQDIGYRVVHNLPQKEKDSFQQTLTIGMIVKPENRAAFEQGIHENIMNHEWLCQFVENYADIFGSNVSECKESGE